MRPSLLQASLLLLAVDAFQAPVAFRPALTTSLRAEESKEATESVFVPPPEAVADDTEASLETVESLGRGAAKVRHSHRSPWKTGRVRPVFSRRCSGKAWQAQGIHG